MRTPHDELAEAAARLHSGHKHYLAELDDYESTVAGIRARCRHERVTPDVWQYGVEWACEDCGQTSEEPFGAAYAQ